MILKSILLNANVCDYSEDGNDTDAQRSIRAMILDKDNTRYKGCAISRHHLEQEWGIVSGKFIFPLVFLNLNKVTIVIK